MGLLALACASAALAVGPIRRTVGGPRPSRPRRSGLIAFADCPDGGATPDSSGGQIRVIRPDGTGRRPLTHGGGGYSLPAWSLDGKLLACTWSRLGSSAIRILRADGTRPRVLARGLLPAWSPDGRPIAFIRPSLDAEGRPGPQIWVIGVDGKGERQLTHEGMNAVPAWSPDGKLILFDTSRRGRPEIWVMDANGRDQRPVVTSLRLLPGRATWQPVPAR